MQKAKSFKELENLKNKPVHSEKKKEVSQEQLAKIAKILGRPQIPYYRFNFGKHNGTTLEEVYKHDKRYLEWLLTEDFLTENLYQIIYKLLNK